MFQLLRGPLLHVGGVDPTGWLWSNWQIEPTISLGLLALLAAYFIAARKFEGTDPAGGAPRTTSRKQKISFVSGLITIFIALGPPISDWSDHYLLTAHMVQHLLLVLLGAPLVLAGTPAWMLEPLTKNPVTNTIGYWLTRPLVAFFVANFIFVVWHMPALYEAALRSEPVHILEHMTLLGSAFLVWWPINGPLPQWPPLPLGLHILYFAAMTIPGSIVGAFITLSLPGMYAPYDTARRIFGIDLATDQQIAGLVMWVGVSSIYLLLMTVSFFRWSAREEAKDAVDASRAAALPGKPDAQITA